MQPEDDLVRFASDEPSALAVENPLSWKLLVVDDDEEVHEATRFALHDALIADRPLRLIHAYTAQQAAEAIAAEPDIAAIMLDVVMESPDAGLRLVRRIREELQLADVRIILRTGQPGYAPELKVIRDYDINDYKTKAELTHTRLMTTLIAAIRSYEQIHAISENRRGLELIVNAAAGLMELPAMSAFAEGALLQIAALLKLPAEGIVCAQKGLPFDNAGGAEALHVVAAAGRLASCIGRPLAQLAEPEIVTAIHDCIARKTHDFGPRHTVLYLHDHKHEAAVFVRSDKTLAPTDRQLVEVFAANVSSCFGNVKLVERLNFIAYHDPLTRLGNRAAFLADLEAAGAAGAADQLVCLLDIEHFTDVNNSLGHEVGDQLLLAVARRLADACEGCHLARIDGDTFGLVGPKSRLAPERLLRLFETPFAAGEQQLQIEIQFGYCRIAGSEPGETLYKRADMALTHARLTRHTRYLHFTPKIEKRTHWRLDVIRELRRAFHAERLAVWYQPQISLHDDEVIGLEALLRWPNVPGFVHSPAVFIPLAEDSGLIIDLGAWVLDQACATFRRLEQLPRRPQRIAVNVSMPQLRTPDFSNHVLRTLAKHRMPASALELEITESILVGEPAVVLRNLNALRAQGVHIAIDDFGTGYSSLSYLRQLPIDCMKIDRSFVEEIDSGRGDVFAETIVALAHKLGMETVAEGVATSGQLARLRELGCGIAQGFLYAKPMPPDTLIKWMGTRNVGLAH
ncbi:putative bifunctional diguanylate cyclase/phosphodiesterase [Aromatoleum evansii]|uniref:putative bifunctional diguanylate cyclase/phosphodiesterase n=1 Tax=Aromatoleum evansii TaxID=59406 RepID=UPI001FE854A6|nr:EAL domain-containing protein [Aromatoleum evansii]